MLVKYVWYIFTILKLKFYNLPIEIVMNNLELEWNWM